MRTPTTRGRRSTAAHCPASRPPRSERSRRTATRTPTTSTCRSRRPARTPATTCSRASPRAPRSPGRPRRRKGMRGLSTFARQTVSLLSGLTVLLALAYGVLLLAGFKPAAVYSGSMAPTLPVGSIAFDKPVASSSIHVGDEITFEDPYVAWRAVTHRVVRIVHTPGGLGYRTKGDANPPL